MLTLACFLLACADDVAKDKPLAAVTPAAEAPPLAPATPPTAPSPGPGFQIDRARSSVKAIGAKITESHELNVSDFDGNIRLDGDTLAGLEGNVRVGSVVSDSVKLDGHLKSPDFFDASAFPAANFASTALVAGGENGATHTVTGTLSIRGVAKEITFPATLTVTPTSVEGHAEFAIVRADFGIVYPGKPDNLIQDKVVLKIDLVAARPTG